MATREQTIRSAMHVRRRGDDAYIYRVGGAWMYGPVRGRTLEEIREELTSKYRVVIRELQIYQPD